MVQLKSLIVHNATTTRSRMILTAREHYERELKQQAFLMLGSLEAFGNPVGLLRGMGQVLPLLYLGEYYQKIHICWCGFRMFSGVNIPMIVRV